MILLSIIIFQNMKKTSLHDLYQNSCVISRFVDLAGKNSMILHIGTSRAVSGEGVTYCATLFYWLLAIFLSYLFCLISFHFISHFQFRCLFTLLQYLSFNVFLIFGFFLMFYFILILITLLFQFFFIY